MKTSIDFLPGRKQRDLGRLVAMIRHEIKDVVMIILYGSYARNTFVEYDETIEYGAHMIYMSDYDILVVTEKAMKNEGSGAFSNVYDWFNKVIGISCYTHPQFINESIEDLNKLISDGYYFYVDILNEGIMLYDSGKYELTTPRKLNFAEIRERAQLYYDKSFSFAEHFLNTVLAKYIDTDDITFASYYLHQAARDFLRTIPLVYDLYGYKDQDIKVLVEHCILLTPEIKSIFPRNCPKEKHLFKLLREAYVKARYSREFVVTNQEFEALLLKVKQLRDMVERVCRERFEYYAQQSKK